MVKFRILSNIYEGAFRQRVNHYFFFFYFHKNASSLSLQKRMGLHWDWDRTSESKKVITKARLLPGTS